MQLIKHALLKMLPVMALVTASAQLMAGQASQESPHENINKQENTSGKTILMVLTSNGEAQGKTAPGYEFDEFSKSYLVFKQHGVAVDIASPKGGAVVADKYDPKKPFNVEVLGDSNIMKKLNNTLPTAKVNASKYDGVFVVGGKGAMFDLPYDLALQQLIADIYQDKGTVAAVCHGPAALVDVKLSDGSYLIANKAVNGFTNKEEKLFGKKWINHFDFMLEDKLIERGGQFQSSDIMLNHVAVDDRLITGQNPSSTTATALALVKSLGVTPQPVKRFADDKTLALVARVLENDDSAKQELANNGEQYKMDLVGVYGFYYLKSANNDAQYRHALTLMQLGQKAINDPKLDMQIAQTQHKIGDREAAVTTLKNLLLSQPDFTPAKEMLQSLSL